MIGSAVAVRFSEEQQHRRAGADRAKAPSGRGCVASLTPPTALRRRDGCELATLGVGQGQAALFSR